MEQVNLRYKLGLSLLQEFCKKEKGNFVFSPLSLGTAFAMLTAGLRGDTKQEVLNFLGGKDEDEVHELFASCMAKEELPLKIANKYVAHKEVEIQPEYSALLERKYQSEVETVDFETEGRAVEKRINQWVSKKTSGMIETLLPDNSLTQDTVMVLLNAVYFKGTWVEEFDSFPEKLDFTLRDGTVAKKDFMMTKSKKFGYHETNHLRLVRIPYKEAGCYMILAIPVEDNKHIDEALLETTTSDWVSAIHALSNDAKFAVNVLMPKFKIEYNCEEVKSHMQQLGVEKIFRPRVGDFSNMFLDSSMSRNVYVSKVFHKCVIEVNEKGTKAAAATAVEVSGYKCRTPEIHIDITRPFYFCVALDDGTPIFSGICANP